MDFLAQLIVGTSNYTHARQTTLPYVEYDESVVTEDTFIVAQANKKNTSETVTITVELDHMMKGRVSISQTDLIHPTNTTKGTAIKLTIGIGGYNGRLFIK